jgi:putative addiction module component (TIGR02574 family)
MSKALARVALDALELPQDARAELASRLIRSLDESHDSPKDVEKAWKKEIERRVKDIQSGKAKMIPAHKVMERLRKTIK